MLHADSPSSEQMSKSDRSSVTDIEQKMLARSNEIGSLRDIIAKLTIGEQLKLMRCFKLVPYACSSLWRRTHKRLDLRRSEQVIKGKTFLFFLQRLRNNFRYVCFSGVNLQEELNLLEQAGVKQLPNVQNCEIMSESDNIEVTELPMLEKPQWPLHALPRLLPRLRRLKVHYAVQVRFIEQFLQLEYLSLYDEVAASVLAGILNCGNRMLKRLHLPHCCGHLNVTGISKLAILRDLALPVTTFLASSEEILALPQLKVLELRQTPEVELTIAAMSAVLRQRASEVEVLQINCRWFDDAYWMQQLELKRCKHLIGLVFVDCLFYDATMDSLCLPPIGKYAVFCQCPDLKDNQVVDFLKKSSNLVELYLIDCPKLTCNLLHDIYKLRIEETDLNLKVSINDCKNIWDEYTKNYGDFWRDRESAMKVELLEEEDRNVKEVQFFFYKIGDTMSLTSNLGSEICT